MDNEDLLRALASASNDVKKSTGGKTGEGAEKKYATAYQACVRAGLKPQIRRKYRRGV